MRSRSSKIVTALGLIMLALAAASFGLLNGARIAHADTNQVYTVDENYAAGGVYARYGPHTNATNRINGYGVYPGQTVKLLCGVTDGDPVGPYQNKTWHFIADLSNPSEGNFWLNDHYVDSPNAANQLAPGESRCANESANPFAAPPAPAPKQPWDLPTRSVHDRIDFVIWVHTVDGWSLHVYPTTQGYYTARLFPVYAFNEVMYDGNMPFSGSMYNQFVCHAVAAPPEKLSWNLDTWRPNVGFAQTLKDGCNP